jgi:hypothetical protein
MHLLITTFGFANCLIKNPIENRTAGYLSLVIPKPSISEVRLVFEFEQEVGLNIIAQLSVYYLGCSPLEGTTQVKDIPAGVEQYEQGD